MAINPIAFTEKVTSNFLSYQLSAYPFTDPNLNLQMRRLLHLGQTRDTPLLKGPYISLSRMFRRGASPADLVQQGIFNAHMRKLVTVPSLYGHQERAIRAIHSGKTTIVSTGTGSGKTECFLYPIISRCLDLRDVGANPGITAVIVYPMNALAEDQMLRLRGLLAGSGISFGIYTGRTPEKRDDVAAKRQGGTQADYMAAAAKAQQAGNKHTVIPMEERASREEMRKSPPQVLLTNVKQMEYLLTRGKDMDLFDNARLEYLVFDEAHTYTGAQGAETACLIRRLRSYFGAGSGSDCVCVATSATIADPVNGIEAGRKFASRFFGVEESNVELVGEEYEAEEWTKAAPKDIPLVKHPAIALETVLKAVDAPEDTRGASLLAAYREITRAPVATGEPLSVLYGELLRNSLVHELVRLLDKPRELGQPGQKADEATGRQPLLHALSSAIGREVPSEEVMVWLALGAAARRDGKSLIRPVVHVFIRGIDGAVATFHGGKPELWLSAEDEKKRYDRGNGEYKALRLPVMTCNTCGQHYFSHALEDFEFFGDAPGGGQAKGNGRFWEAKEQTNGGSRVVLYDRLISDDDAGSGEDDDEGVEQGEVASAKREAAKLSVCSRCGSAHPPGSGDKCFGCGSVKALATLFAAPQRVEHPGWLTRCLCCGARGKARGSGYREPCRPVRAVTVSDVHVLAQDMIQQLSHPRRLLVFADSRQDAAFQAGWMRDHARRFRLRSLMQERIREGDVRVFELVDALLKRFLEDNALSEALAPEVWTVAPRMRNPKEHREEMKSFLTIQVIREIMTSARQRVGLEPWGRVQVAYDGLTPECGFVKTWAAALGLKSQELYAGIVLLMDGYRRSGVLFSDEPMGFLTSIWAEDDHFKERGYTPEIRGIPAGVVFRRSGDQSKKNWVKEFAGHMGGTRQSVLRWCQGNKSIADSFLQALWRFLVDESKILVGVKLTGHKGNALPGTAGANQIDISKLVLSQHSGLFRCTKCRRSHVHAPPRGLCMGYRCGGSVEEIMESGENYDLMVLDEQYEMLMPEEHSAQVPADTRNQIELAFKSPRGDVNTLVATPTLELGVDIGALDAVLMRNVPPLPANYWQRAGRAGRRDRMAVDVTYCRGVSHDRQYFEKPMGMLAGDVDPPSFNLRNVVMVRKHVRSAVITRLRQLERSPKLLEESEREEIREALEYAFPTRVRDYLFDEDGSLRPTAREVGPLQSVINSHREDILSYVRAAFDGRWPKRDSEVFADDLIEATLDGMALDLGEVMERVRGRAKWADNQIKRLNAKQGKTSTLEEEEKRLRQRCERLLERFKDTTKGRSSSYQDGFDVGNTQAVLESEGYLPGYGLEVGSIQATTEMSRHRPGLGDFVLPRPPSLALLEYVPGNMVYANRNKFVATRFHIDAERPRVEHVVDVPSQAIWEKGDSRQQAGGLTSAQLETIPVTDVTLRHASQITDDEENRFRLSSTVYGFRLGRHGNGSAYEWGPKKLQFQRALQLRLVNVGVASKVEVLGQAGMGFPICQVCGESRSPFSSSGELDKFHLWHKDRCGRPVTAVGFHTDIDADAITIRSLANRKEAYSVLEALRFGAAQVLEMDHGDLNILVEGKTESQEVDGVLYDPMPGGSGLLDQLLERFASVTKAALKVVNTCPSVCGSSCADCLQTFRNAFYHGHLDRTVAAQCLETWGEKLALAHDIPPSMPSTAPNPKGGPANSAEDLLRDCFLKAGFSEPVWKRQFQLGTGWTTTPDCCWSFDEECDLWICVYLDGMSQQLHGNAETAQQDKEIRADLRSQGHEVIEVTFRQLQESQAMKPFLRKIGKLLGA